MSALRQSLIFHPPCEESSCSGSRTRASRSAALSRAKSRAPRVSPSSDAPRHPPGTHSWDTHRRDTRRRGTRSPRARRIASPARASHPLARTQTPPPRRRRTSETKLTIPRALTNPSLRVRRPATRRRLVLERAILARPAALVDVPSNAARSVALARALGIIPSILSPRLSSRRAPYPSRTLRRRARSTPRAREGC